MAAQSLRRLVTTFDIVLFAIQFSLYGFGTLALRRKRRGLLTVTKYAALAVASLPVASFLANVVPWWRTHPAIMVSLAIVVAIGLVTALAAAGPWRRSVTGSGAVVAGVTCLALTLDVMTGNNLQVCSMLGYTPLVAGRFYGFGNPSWALWITGIIMVAGALAGHLLTRFKDDETKGRRAATAVVVGAGVLALVIDGAPMWGADFGGIIALFPGFAVFGFMISGRKVKPTRLLAVLAVGAVVVLGISFLDSLRANPTHIGEFWDNLLNGDAGTVIYRKFRGMIRTFGNWELTLIAVAAVGFLFFALLRPLTWRASALHTAYEQSPALRPTLVAVLVTGGVGMLVNDSGVAIPALAFTVAIPLALVASVRALELAPDDEQPAEPERSESGSVPKV